MSSFPPPDVAAVGIVDGDVDGKASSPSTVVGLEDGHDDDIDDDGATVHDGDVDVVDGASDGMGPCVRR